MHAPSGRELQISNVIVHFNTLLGQNPSVRPSVRPSRRPIRLFILETFLVIIKRQRIGRFLRYWGAERTDDECKKTVSSTALPVALFRFLVAHYIKLRRRRRRRRTRRQQQIPISRSSFLLLRLNSFGFFHSSFPQSINSIALYFHLSRSLRFFLFFFFVTINTKSANYFSHFELFDSLYGLLYTADI